MEFAGRLHPLLVHLPIALLLAGGIIEFARLRWKSPLLTEAAVWCFGLGALFAAFAVGSGLILEEHSRFVPEVAQYVEQHETLGIATAISAAAAFASEYFWRNASAPIKVWLRRIVAWTTLALIILTGHFGALAVWGGDWFS